MRYTFKKSERLSGKKTIKELFDKGSSFYSHPFKVISLPAPSENTQILITVPKRLHKKAVTRNKLKRRVKEGYRLNKDLLQIDKKLHIAYIYTSREILDFKIIEKGVKSSFDQLVKLYGKG